MLCLRKQYAQFTVTFVLVIVLVCSCCISINSAQMSSVTCFDTEDDPRTEFCPLGAMMWIHGANFGCKPWEEYIVSDDPLIYMKTNLQVDSNTVAAQLFHNDSRLPDGPYNIKILSNKPDKTKFNGTLLIGVFYGQHKMNLFYEGEPPTDAVITGQSTNKIYNGLVFDIIGRFNTSKTYAVYMYANEYNGGEYIPSCNNATVSTSSTTLSCIISDVVDYNYRFRYVVKEVESGKYITIQGTLPQLKPIPKPNTTANIQTQFSFYYDHYTKTVYCACLIAFCIVLYAITITIIKCIMQSKKQCKREYNSCTCKENIHDIKSKTLI